MKDLLKYLECQQKVKEICIYSCELREKSEKYDQCQLIFKPQHFVTFIMNIKLAPIILLKVQSFFLTFKVLKKLNIKKIKH